MHRGTIPEVFLRVGGKDLSVGSGGTHQHRDCMTGEVQALVPLAGAEEVNEAVECAAAAFEGWRSWRPEARRDVLLRLAALLQDNREEIVRLTAVDGGTAVAFNHFGVDISAAWTSYYAGWADKLDGQLVSTFDTRGEFAYTTHEPLGVVGVIITWNGPLFSLGMKVVPALAAGNTVVIKPSEMTPFIPDLFYKLALEAGIPPGVINMVPGGPAAGEALVTHPKVEKISFTGGPVSARKILAACAEQLKPAVLELGGKSANLVFPDTDIDGACHRAINFSIGIFSGQGCSLPTRLLVERSIYQQVLDKLVEIGRGLRIGDPFDTDTFVGPLINAAACDRVMGMIDRVRAEGSGRIILGGHRVGGALEGKNFIEPTIIADVDPMSEIAQVEVFGPVLCVIPFDDEDEAVRIANATAYGLAAHIQSNDLKRVHRLAERLKAGGVYVNGAGMMNPYTPFGGLGLSGYGREGGRMGIEEFTRNKSVVIA